MSSETVGDFKMKVMQEALPRMANIPEFLELDGSAEFLELCKKAAPQIATLNELAGKNGKSLCHGDALTYYSSSIVIVHKEPFSTSVAGVEPAKSARDVVSYTTAALLPWAGVEPALPPRTPAGVEPAKSDW